MDDPELLSAMPSPLIRFSDVPEDSDVEVTIPKPIKPKPVEPLPSLPKASLTDHANDKVLVTWEKYTPPTLNPDGLANGDNQLALLMGYPPVYPNRALMSNIEGYAVVGFSVSQAGEVFDPYILESEPKGVFDRSALQAIVRFRYRAQLVNGKPIATDGQRYMFTYQMD